MGEGEGEGSGGGTRLGTNEPVEMPEGLSSHGAIGEGGGAEFERTMTSAPGPGLGQTLEHAPGPTGPKALGGAPARAPKPSLFGAGQVVAGHFKVVRPLGSGGMGEVFIARDRKLGRRVALKTLKLPEFATDAERERFAQLFERDAASTAQLNHPNIVTIFQFGDHGGAPFFVLELVDGAPLDAVLERDGALPEREALKLGAQLCEALSYAHSQGVIHRDLKPANLMRTKDGRLKVLDFGIALMRKAKDEMQEAFGERASMLDARLGEEPVAAGTPAYMAPEQLRGLEQDGRADVWAAGVTLFEMLTGSRPYASPLKVTDGFEVSWPEGCEVTQPTRQAVEGCLAFSLGARTPTMSALGDQLNSALELLSSARAESKSRGKKTNLVPFEDAFVGREADLDALDSTVFGDGARTGHRLVTIVGPGGVGKTRLVTEWGLGAIEREWVREVAFCSLAEARTRDGVLFALSGALGAPLAHEDPVAQLGHVFERRLGLVLILDNCEQVADEVAALISGWAASLEGVRVVATSRVALGVRAERQVGLEPLGDAEMASALYTARAQQVHPGWTCPEDQEGALAELVDELDRLPLALELAAARVQVLGPRKMLGRIAQRFKLLKTRARGAPDRQATLRGAIAWSWELLDSAHRSAMAQMSVFEGSFTLEAAEEVVDLLGAPEGEEEPFVLDVVEGLVSSSLLKADAGGERFRMLVSVRAFCAEALVSSGKGGAARRRHARWFGRRGHDDVERERGKGHAQLSLEADDLEAASLWGLTPGRSAEERDWAMACTAALAATLELRGPFHLAGALAERVLGRAEEPSANTARALGRIGLLASVGGQFEMSRQLLGRALDASRRLGDLGAEGVWLGHLGNLEHHADVGEARRLYGQAMAISRAAGDPRSECTWLGFLGNLERGHGNWSEARAHLERAAAISAELGDLRLECTSLGNLGSLEAVQNNVAEAREMFERAAATSRELGDLANEGLWLGSLGLLEREQGGVTEARVLFERALRLFGQVGDLTNEGFWLGCLGLLEHDHGHAAVAREMYERALAAARQTGNRRFEGLWLGNAGNLERDHGDRAKARGMYERALAIFRELGDLRAECNWLGCLGTLERDLGHAAVAREMYERALEVAKRLGDPKSEGIWLGFIGLLELEQGGVAEARGLLERALELSAQVGDAVYGVLWEAGLGQCDASGGLGDAARSRLDACIASLPDLRLSRGSRVARGVLELADELGADIPDGAFAD